MKKLLTLLVVIAAGTTAAYGWYLQSVHHVLIELKQGVEKPNLAQVDPYVDYERIGSSLLDYSQARAELAAEEAVGGIGKGVVGGLANLFRSVGEARAQRNMKDDIRQSIAQGKFREIAEEFSPADGLTAIASIETLGNGSKRVTFKGECEGGPATFALDFERVENGGAYRLGTYRCIGLSKKSAQALAAVCHSNAR